MAKYEFSIEGAADWLVIRDTNPPTGGNQILVAVPRSICGIDVEAIYQKNPACKVHKQQLDRGQQEFLVCDFLLTDCGPAGGPAFDETTWFAWAKDNIGLLPGSSGGTPSLPAGAATEAKQDVMISVLQNIDANTDDLETIAANQLTELQAINLNTANLEALLNSIDANTSDLSAILAELQTQTGILNTHTTSLNNIVSAINTADTNNVAELTLIRGQLIQVISDLGDINANTAPLEASLTAIETAINTQSGITNANLTTIIGQMNSVITELQAINTTLTSIEGQFTGTCTWTNAVISGNPAYVVPGATYKSIQLTVLSGVITKGAVAYPEGVWAVNSVLNKNINAATFDASAGTGFIDFLS